MNRFYEVAGMICYIFMLYLTITSKIEGRTDDAIYYLIWAIFVYCARIYFMENKTKMDFLRSVVKSIEIKKEVSENKEGNNQER